MRIYLKKTMNVFALAGLFAGAALAQSPKTKPLPLLGKDAWAFLRDSGPANHPMSGLVCPDTAGSYRLTGLKQLDYTGSNVQCVYRPEAGHFGSMIIAVNYQGKAVSAERIIQDGIKRAQDGFGAVLIKSAPVQVTLGTDRTACHHDVMKFQVKGEERHSVNYACMLSGYSYNIAGSIDPAHKADFLQAARAFGRSQQKLFDHAKKCDAFDATMTRNREKPKEVMLNANAFQFQPVGIPCLRFTQPAEDGGLIGLTWPDSKLTPMSFHLTYDVDMDANPAYRLQDMMGDAPDATGRMTLLVFEDKQGARKAYRFYNGVPIMEQVLEDMLAIGNGELKPMFTATPQADGGYNYQMHKLD